jgi:chromosome segregation ATPase
MSLANVNIGTAANDGTGDPLRSAFRTINQNFANLAPFASNGNITYNAGVASVAGRTGNVTLTITDITGAASTGYVDAVAANIANIAANIAGNLNTVIWANVTGKPTFALISETGSWDDLGDIPVNVSNAITQTEINTANSAMVANVTAANTRIGQLQSNINTLFSNAASQTLDINALRANITAANAAIAAVSFASVNANVTAANAAIAALVTANIDQGSYIELNTSRIAAANVEIGKLRANITAANAAIETAAVAWVSNAGTQQTQINSINANVSAANSAISSLSSAITANNVAQASLISSLTANAGSQTTDINSLRANITAANAAMSTITANITAFQIYSNANAVAQRTQIINLQENLNATDGNVAALVLANTVQNSILERFNANIGNLWVWTDNTDNRAYNLETTFDQLVYANIAVEANIANLRANTAELASNIVALYSNAATQQGQFVSVNSNVTAQTSRIDDLYSNIVVRMADITTLFSNATTQSNQLFNLVANAYVQQLEIDELTSNIGSLTGVVGDFDGRLGTVEYLYPIVDENITELYQRVGTLEEEIIAVNANVNAANAAIITAEGNLTVITDDIIANLAAKTNDITGANTEIATTNSAIGIVNNTIIDIEANVAVLYNLFTVSNANIISANTTVSALTVNVQVVESNLSLAQIDITNLQTSLGDGNLVYTPNNATHWNGTISNVAAALDQLAARIWAIENP